MCVGELPRGVWREVQGADAGGDRPSHGVGEARLGTPGLTLPERGLAGQRAPAGPGYRQARPSSVPPTVPQGVAQCGLPGRDPQGPEGRKCTLPPRRRPSSRGGAAGAGGGGLADITAAEPDSLLLPDTTAPSEMTPTCPDARSTGQDGAGHPPSTCPLGKAGLPQYTPRCPQHPARAPSLPTAPCPTSHPAHSTLPTPPQGQGDSAPERPAVAAPLRPDAFPKGP